METNELDTLSQMRQERHELEVAIQDAINEFYGKWHPTEITLDIGKSRFIGDNTYVVTLAATV